jgi:hypothetical protein
MQLDPTKPRRPREVVTSTSPDGETHPIVAINQHLHEIELLDDSVWKLTDPGGVLIGWRGDDKVTIQPGSFYITTSATESVPPIGTVFVYDVELIVTYATHSKVPNGLTQLDLYFVPYKGRWVEVLTASDYRAYKAGRCP